MRSFTLKLTTDLPWLEKPDGSLVPLVQAKSPVPSEEKEVDLFQQECQKLGAPWV